MTRFTSKIISLALVIMCATNAYSQEQSYFERLPTSILNIPAPSSRVSGTPGNMNIEQSACLSSNTADSRRRIVNTAIQEWAFFGSSVQIQSQTERPNPVPRSRRVYPRLNPEESARLADSIAGYWSATPNSSWILAQQNETWKGPQGIASRWGHPWSAAFISWVMCESGLGEQGVFERAIAHHSYIDQAILAKEDNDSKAAYQAYDPGEVSLVPGDLICRGSRPAYKTIAQRREQIAQGARTHCDIVVKVDYAAEQIFAIGGNVRASVRLKQLPASISQTGYLRPDPNDRRPIFAHLKLNAEPIELDALSNSPTMQAYDINL